MVTNVSQVVLVGCGAIGLPLAVAFASRGCDVVGVDTDAVRLAALQAGRISDLDAGLGEAFASAVIAGRLSFQATLARSHAPRAFILAVPSRWIPRARRFSQTSRLRSRPSGPVRATKIS